MAKISRLYIGGIRSFGPDDKDIQYIKFQAPVTLILGENGCGKTTIIEALKYACTGITPSGVKSNFVYNPQLHNRSATKATIKLKFTDSKGQELTICRGMQVEQTGPNTQRFSTLDSTVKITTPTGDNVPISTRCGDIGKLICERLGVSESILNNVIFCHQDNSLWPLEEGSKVKAKFDEIFDATKYNKCIDSMRKHLTSQKVDLKLLNGQLSQKRDKKDYVEKQRGILQTRESDLVILDTNIAKKDEESEPVKNRIEEICRKEDSFTTLRGELSSKETEYENCLEIQKDIRKKLKQEFKGTDQELEDDIKRFTEKLRNLPSMDQINKDIEKCTAASQKTQVRIGQLESEGKQYDQKIKERDEHIQNLHHDLRLKDDLTLDSNTSVDNTLSKIKSALTESKGSVDKLQAECAKEEHQIQQNIDKSREELAKVEQKISSSKSQIQDKIQKIRDVGLQLIRLGTSDEDLKQMNKKLEKMDNDLKKLEASMNTKTIEHSIKQDKLEIQKLEDNLESLEKDYKVLQRNFALESDIETRRKDISDRETKIYELKSRHQDEFIAIFGEVPENNLKAKVQKLLDENKTKVNSLQKKIEQKNTEVTRYETNINYSKKTLKGYEADVEKNTRQIKTVTNNRNFETLCKDLEAQLEKARKSKGQLSSTSIIFEKFIENFKSAEPQCPVCNTDFHNNESAVAIIVSKIKNQIKDVPVKLAKVEEELKKLEKEFNGVQQLRPIYNLAENQKNKLIPDITVEIDSLSRKYQTITAEKLSLLNDIENPEQLVDNCSKVLSDAALIDKYQSEVSTYKMQTKELRDQLEEIDSEKSRDEIEGDIKVFKINISEKRQLCDSNQKKINQYTEQCQRLKEQRNQLFDKCLQLEKSMQGKPQLLEKEKELKAEDAKLKEYIKELEQEMDPIKETLAGFVTDLEILKVENKAKVSDQFEIHNKLNSTFDNIRQLQKSIVEIKNKNIEKDLETQLINYNKFKTEYNQLTKQKEELVCSNLIQRELQDNVDLRNKRNQAQKLNQVISALKVQIGDYNYTSLQRDKLRLQQKYTNLDREKNSLKGQRTQLELQIKEIQKDLDKDENKEAYNAYKKKFFEIKIKDKMVSDMQLFIKGLENAIIEFHKEKMIKINNCIKDYWRSIYRGNDIDYIQVKTEQGESVTSRRVYNYKVIQVRDDTEIDMRGCCSAGQKVLACLIIRMALSTVFSHTCGILALDEPTTNLDRENIVSLSETLARMIHDRRVEKNFQLLVITHDEDFVKALSQSERINSCLRVTRDRNGKSVVKREMIS